MSNLWTSNKRHRLFKETYEHPREIVRKENSMYKMRSQNEFYSAATSLFNLSRKTKRKIEKISTALKCEKCSLKEMRKNI